MPFLTDDQQKATVADLARFPNAAVIRHQRLVDLWSAGAGHTFSDRPLVAYIDLNFHTVARSGEYEFMVRKTRQPIDLQDGY